MLITIVLSFFIGFQAHAAKSVLLTGFDAYKRSAKINNSSFIAKKLTASLKLKYPDLEVSFCQLSTLYHESTHELQDCIKQMKNKPDLVLSFGNTACKYKKPKLEIRAKNKLKNQSSDNNRIRYDGEPIDSSNRDKYLRARINWNSAYCKLSSKSKRNITFSNNAGTFVCNELLYNMTSKFPEYNFGFIHVPGRNCRSFERKTKRSISALIELIENLINSEATQKAYEYPRNRSELIKIQKNFSSARSCEKSILKDLLKLDW